MTRGKAGQTSSVSFAGVDTLVDTLTAYKQAANSSDVRGDVVVQKQRLAIVDRRAPVTAKPASLFWCLDQLDLHPHAAQNPVISSRTPSGSVSIDINWPTSHRLSQRPLQDVAQPRKGRTSTSIG